MPLITEPSVNRHRAQRETNGSQFVRNVAVGALYETFFVSAIASLLVIRAALALSGFPRLGGGGLHIAHMLWGGLFMVAGLVILLGFVGRVPQFTAAVVGGLGFGTFIDEIGKFVTSDNNYFFRPAVALIYVVFVLLFLVARAVERRSRFTDEELLANAFDLAREERVHHRRAAHTSEVLAYLRRQPESDHLIAGLRHSLERAGLDAPLLPRPLRWLERRSTILYMELIRSRKINSVVLILIGLYGVFGLLSLILLISGAWPVLTSGRPEELIDTFGIAEDGAFAGTLLTGLLAAIGILRLAWSRPAAYAWFQRAVLINLLLAQVFTFYLQQFGSLGGLTIDLVLLLLLSGMRRTERLALASRGAG